MNSVRNPEPPPRSRHFQSGCRPVRAIIAPASFLIIICVLRPSCYPLHSCDFKLSMQCLAMSYIDVEGKYKRGPQIIMRKDAGAIIARTGLQPDWKCLDLGAPAAFLPLSAPHFPPTGPIPIYKKKKQNADIIKKNIEASGFR